jgi:hypothetical protein
MQRDALYVAGLIESTRAIRGYLAALPAGSGTTIRCCVTLFFTG